jgi:hypothetical protein
MLTEKDKEWIAKMLWLTIKALTIAFGGRHSDRLADSGMRKAFIEAAKR